MRFTTTLLLALTLSAACHRAETHAPIPAATGGRVIFVGLDGADWQLLDRYMADGTMPNLARLVRGGERRDLRTQHPPLSPLVWTSMMTGTSPLEHRILDFTRFNPATHVKEPITSDERAVPAIWNMATLAGKRVDVFGLWATYPAEAINGTMVSDRLFSFQYDEATPPAGAVSPVSFEATARDTATTVARATGYEAMHAYVPSLTADEYAQLAANANPFAHPVTALRRIVIETEVIHRLARERIEADRPDIAIVYFQGTDAIGHLFAPYAPPKLDAVSQADYDRYHAVPQRYFARIDAILGDYMQLAGKLDARIVIASDHGFEWGEHRSPVSSTAVATAAKWHREYGIFATSPGKYAGDVTQASDLCGVLLDIAGMPRDLSSYRRRWRATPAKTAVVAAASREELEKLKSLGYIGANEATRGDGSSTRTAGSFNNEGLILREAGRDDDALRAFDAAARLDPNSASAMWNEADLLRKLHRDPARAAQLLDRAIALDANEPRWLLTRGRLALERHDCRAALADFRRATTLAPGDAVAHASAGTAAMCLGDAQDARHSFERSLSIDREQPEVVRALRALPPSQ